MAKTTKIERQGTKDLEETVQALETIIASGYSSRQRVYLLNFVRGIFFGFGSVLGGTVIVAGIIGLLSVLGEVPLIGGLVDAVNNSLQNRHAK